MTTAPFAPTSHNHDTSYVNLTGDVMTGALGFANGTTPMTYIYQSGVTNASRGIALHSPAFPEYGLMYNDLNDEFVFTGAGDTNLVVSVAGTGGGDNAVRLGASAISSPEILDEPGIAQGRSIYSQALGSSAMQDLITVTITIPKYGYIFLQGRTTFTFLATSGVNGATLQIDETAGGSILYDFGTRVFTNTYSSTDRPQYDCTSQRTYYKGAGTYTFRLEAMLDSTATGTVVAGPPVLTALYIPSSYGMVQTVSTTPNGDPNAKAMQIPDPTGNGTTTAYQVDLRALELKATKAREEALRAELELQRAQSKQMHQQ